MNAVNVSFAPAASYSAFFFSRSAATRAKFTSYTEYTCGDVCALSTMCSAIFLRMTLIGTTLDVLARLERRARGAGTAARRLRRRRGAIGIAPRLDEREDVLLRDAAADPGAVDLGDVDVVLPRDAADERRRLLPPELLPSSSLPTARRRLGAWRRGRNRWCGARGRLRLCPAARPRPPAAPALGAAPARLGRRRRLTCRRRSIATTLLTGDRLPFLDLDLGEHAGDRRRDLRVDLVGRNLEQRLVAVDRVADLLDPADDRAFGDRLAHLGHHDVGHMP